MCRASKSPTRARPRCWRTTHSCSASCKTSSRRSSTAYSTPSRIFVDADMSYRVGPGSEGLMDPSVLPPGGFVSGRLLHNFHVRDGLLSREIAYFIPNPPTGS